MPRLAAHDLPIIDEAVAAAAAVRMWSTVLNGMNYDYADFTAEIDSMHAGSGQ